MHIGKCKVDFVAGLKIAPAAKLCSNLFICDVAVNEGVLAKVFHVEDLCFNAAAIGNIFRSYAKDNFTAYVRGKSCLFLLVKGDSKRFLP